MCIPVAASTGRRFLRSASHGMRAARRDFCLEIRRKFPLYPTPKAKDRFLEWLDTRVQAEEENDSDEYLWSSSVVRLAASPIRLLADEDF